MTLSQIRCKLCTICGYKWAIFDRTTLCGVEAAVSYCINDDSRRNIQLNRYMGVESNRVLSFRQSLETSAIGRGCHKSVLCSKAVMSEDSNDVTKFLEYRSVRKP